MSRGWVYNLDSTELKSLQWLEQVISQTTKVNLRFWARSDYCLLALQWKITMELLWISIFWIPKPGARWSAVCGPLVQVLPLNLAETRHTLHVLRAVPALPIQTTKVLQSPIPAAAWNRNSSGVAADLQKLLPEPTVQFTPSTSLKTGWETASSDWLSALKCQHSPSESCSTQHCNFNSSKEPHTMDSSARCDRCVL